MKRFEKKLNIYYADNLAYKIKELIFTQYYGLDLKIVKSKYQYEIWIKKREFNDKYFYCIWTYQPQEALCCIADLYNVWEGIKDIIKEYLRSKEA